MNDAERNRCASELNVCGSLNSGMPESDVRWIGAGNASPVIRCMFVEYHPGEHRWWDHRPSGVNLHITWGFPKPARASQPASTRHAGDLAGYLREREGDDTVEV